MYAFALSAMVTLSKMVSRQATRLSVTSLLIFVLVPCCLATAKLLVSGSQIQTTLFVITVTRKKFRGKFILNSGGWWN